MHSIRMSMSSLRMASNLVKKRGLSSFSLPTKCAEVFRYHAEAVKGLATHPDGRLISASVDRTVQLKDVKSSAPPIKLITVKSVTPFWSLNVLMKNWLIAAGTKNGFLYFWRLNGQDAGGCGGKDQGSETPLTSVTAFFDKQQNKYYVPASSSDGKIKVWDTATAGGKPVYTFETHSGEVNVITMLQCYDKVSSTMVEALASGSSKGKIIIWQLNYSSSARSLYEFSHKEAVRAFTTLKFRNLLVSGSDDKTIRVWNPSNLEPLIHKIDKKSDGSSFSPVSSLATFQDGSIASGHSDGEINLWNPLDPMKPHLGTLTSGHNQRVNALTVLNDGTLASGSDDTTIRLWIP